MLLEAVTTGRGCRVTMGSESLAEVGRPGALNTAK